MNPAQDTLVSATWLAEHLKDEKVKVLDASWCMPNEKKDIYADFAKVRIPGAVLFDIDAVADKSTTLPHMLPPARQFEEVMSKMGISNDDTVVIYDSSGKFVASARVWWTFRVFGHKNVKVVDGGLPQWLKLSLPTQSGDSTPPQPARYKASFNGALVKNMQQIKENTQNGAFEVVDARPGDRFIGKTPEPRPGLKSGHIPNTKSVPWVSVLDVNNLTYLKQDDFLNAFKSKNVDLTAPIITTCGSGVTASVLSLGLYLNGIDSAVYDGSFCEWGQPHLELPVNSNPEK